MPTDDPTDLIRRARELASNVVRIDWETASLLDELADTLDRLHRQLSARDAALAGLIEAANEAPKLFSLGRDHLTVRKADDGIGYVPINSEPERRRIVEALDTALTEARAALATHTQPEAPS